jgi:class 3 adenylate cyclase/NAD(P)-dependent dehydrogenase (short-subunit alcohol dehydrogenase family)
MYPIDQEVLAKLNLTDQNLTGQTALITGAARGIGEASAYILASLGANIIIADILPRGEEVAERIRSQGGKAHYIHCDVSDTEQVIDLTTRAPSIFGQVDILLNDVMRIYVAPIIEVTVDDWDEVLNTNLRSAFLTIRGLLPGMVTRQHGVIVNMIAYEGAALSAAYSASKMGLRSLALTAAREVGPDAGVSIYAFVPGIVDTPGVREDIVPGIVAKLGMPEEQVLASLAQNPGYPGLVPVQHCASALVYTIVHAPEYHGQVADPFEPLNRYEVIQLGPTPADTEPIPVDIEASGPVILRKYLREVTKTNRDLEKRIEIRTRELAEAHARSESLLLNILPEPIAERLKQGEATIADYFPAVTVLFADIVNFTPLSNRYSPETIVEILDGIFSAFDSVAQRHQLEKIKTIGDCYMVVGGLPQPRPDHAEVVAQAALDIRTALSEVSRVLGVPLVARIGLHTGAVVAGVIGRRKFSYDLWGDTVNTASRMESHCLADHIQCTREVYEALRDQFIFERRGEIDVKGKGMMETYFLIGRKTGNEAEEVTEAFNWVPAEVQRIRGD